MSKHFYVCVLLVLLCGLAAYPQPAKKTQKQVPLGTPVKTFVDKDGALTTAHITGDRDLSLYDDSGHFDCRRYTDDWFKDQQKANAKISSSIDAARSFIWKHWEEKQRGYLRITFNSVDATSTSHIFIEPDAKRDWRIVWRIVRNHALVKGGFVNDVPVIRHVERVDSGKMLVFASADGTEQEKL